MMETEINEHIVNIETEERTGDKYAQKINSDDLSKNLIGAISVFLPEPKFQGQTKDKLSNKSIQKVIENAIKDRFETLLSNSPQQTESLLKYLYSNTVSGLASSMSSLTKDVRIVGPSESESTSGAGVSIPNSLTSSTIVETTGAIRLSDELLPSSESSFISSSSSLFRLFLGISSSHVLAGFESENSLFSF